ncbi:MAG: hypothetical protein KIG95_13420 [Comamonas sp.]|nr:hypothetical protein [Comamonas sp.]
MVRSLVLDANLLLLLIIGQLDGGLHLHKSKRLGAYNRADLHSLHCLIEKFDYLTITPYLAAEVSNLIDLKYELRQRAFTVAQIFFTQSQQANVVICEDAQHEAFIQYGITDVSLALLVRNHVVVTNDNRLLPVLYAVNPKNVLPFASVQAVLKS